MSRGLGAVLRVRRLAERRRVAEQARTHRAVEEAREIRSAAIAARDALPPPTALELRAAALVLERLGGLARHDDVLLADQQLIAALRADELATTRRVEAAVELRSVERLDDRRRLEAAKVASRQAEQRLDAVAIERWHRAEGDDR